MTHENEKSPGVAGSWVKMRTGFLSTSQLCFLLCHLHFHVHFPPKGGQTSPEISISLEPPMERECLLPNNLHKSPGKNLTQAGELCPSSASHCSHRMEYSPSSLMVFPTQDPQTQIWARDSAVTVGASAGRRFRSTSCARTSGSSSTARSATSPSGLAGTVAPGHRALRRGRCDC